MRQIVRVCVVLLVVFLVLLVIYTVFRSRAEYLRAQEAALSGDEREQAYRLRWAIRWYVPLNPYSRRGVTELLQLARAQEKRGSTEEALWTYRDVRSSILAVRSLYIPYREWLELANARIAALSAGRIVEGTPDAEGLLEAARQQQLAQLRAPIRPYLLWSVLVEVGFVGWVAAALGFVLQGMAPRPEGKRGRRLAAWGGTAGAFFVLWLLSLVRA